MRRSGEAKRSISFENFIFHEGIITNQFAEALAERARAGVKVHFLQDAFGCDCLHGAAMYLLKRSGVEVEIFRFLHLTRFNYRTHRKLLVIDGRVGFVGGVGIGDEWDGNGNSAHQWRDSHYRAEGPVVAQMQQAFMDNWMQTARWCSTATITFLSLRQLATPFARCLRVRRAKAPIALE